MTTRFNRFNCWFPEDDGEDESDAREIEAYDAENAAENAVETFRSGVDYADHINGDPIRVAVRCVTGGIPGVRLFDVHAHAEVLYSADEVTP